ncbi:DUF1801 domain-containing protein [Myroides pelagicus]|uniref:DUF1801 domain-containing protein n=1 Tax=Myroides pelagicus TaxID=270914 RepID=A0A7K1GML8_9FLAO|nr:DUF1801 domain-containing protein [Myroides pelagicus]
MSELDNYYLKKEEPLRGCLLSLRKLILKQDKQVWETTKWGGPCFMYRNRMFCFLAIDKKSKNPYLLLVEGNRLTNPLLETGNRTRMKSYPVALEEDIAVVIVEEIIQEALALYWNGIVSTK